MGLERNDLGVFGQSCVRVQFLLCHIRLDVEVNAVAQNNVRLLIERLVAFRKELEGEFQMRLRLATVRVNVARSQRKHRIRGQQPARFRRKNIRVAPDLVNGPGGTAALSAARAQHDARIGHVMEHKTTAHGFDGSGFGDVIDFSHFKSRYIPVFRQARGNLA